jgi:hypothetical protein
LPIKGRYREFVLANPVLAEVMFSRPVADFDATTAALTFFALLDGLAAAENAGRLGSSRQSVDRRWSLGVKALFAGLRP